MSQLLELPDQVYDALLEAAQASGQTPVTWIEEKLPKKPATLTPEEREAAHARLRELTVPPGYGTGTDTAEREAALARLWQHSVSVESAVGIDNEQIDADLAAEYGNDHSPPFPKQAGS